MSDLVLQYFDDYRHFADFLIASFFCLSGIHSLLSNIGRLIVPVERGKFLIILGLVIWTNFPIALGYAQENEREKLREEASALENAMRKTIQSGATQSVTSVTVPGFKSNSPSQSQFYNNEKTLKSQTEITKNSNEASTSISRSIAKRPKITQKELEQWVTLGTLVHDNPHGYAKGFSGSSGDCTSQISQSASPTTWEYSCDEGVTLSQYTQSCEIPLQTSQFTEYVYQCRTRWNQADCTYEPDPYCSLLSLNSSCSKPKQISNGNCNSIAGICSLTCEDRIMESTCRHEVTGLKPIKVKTSPLRFYWNTDACRSIKTKQGCTLSSEVCATPAGTKLIGTEWVYKDCWKKNQTYACSAKGDTKNDCKVPNKCQKKTSICLSRDTSTGNCQNWEHNYICRNDSPDSSIGGYCEEDIYCIDGNCVKSKRPQSRDFTTAISSLNLIGEVEKDFDTSNLQIFPGTHAKCDKAIAGLQNCCSNDGLLVKLGARCSHKDHSVARNRTNGLCYQIGTYCTKKTLFGICLKKRKTFCCFNSTLAKAVHIQGRSQIRMGWGNAKFPNCSGYTISNFQKLDLSKIDLSDFYADVLSDFSGPNSTQVSKAIRERLLRTYKCPPNCPKK